MNHLSDAEWAVMEVLWERNSCTLGEISDVLADSMGWRQNTERIQNLRGRAQKAPETAG